MFMARFITHLKTYIRDIGNIRGEIANIFNPIQDGHFRGCSQMMGEKGPVTHILHWRKIYPTMMELGTVIPYLKKIQQIYESRDTHPEFCWHQHFFTKNQQILLYQEAQM